MFGNTIAKGSGLKTMLDYDGRTDGLAIYVGIAKETTPENGGEWLLMKLAYDGNDQLISKKVNRTSNWTNRASATYS